MRKRGNKYGAKPVEIDGYKFKSKLEGRRYRELKLLQKAGKILALRVHPRYEFANENGFLKQRSERYPNGRKVVAELDFAYYDVEKEADIVEDTKGEDTPVSRLKRALLEWHYGIKVEIVR